MRFRSLRLFVLILFLKKSQSRSYTHVLVGQNCGGNDITSASGYTSEAQCATLCQNNILNGCIGYAWAQSLGQCYIKKQLIASGASSTWVCAQAQLSPYAPAFPSIGQVNCAGSDIAYAGSFPSILNCRSLCDSFSSQGCVGYSYNPTAQTCYIKSALVSSGTSTIWYCEKMMHNNYVSLTYGQPWSCAGNDILTLSNSQSLDDCSSACDTTQSCVGFSYGVASSYNDKMCVLKSQVIVPFSTNDAFVCYYHPLNRGYNQLFAGFDCNGNDLVAVTATQLQIAHISASICSLWCDAYIGQGCVGFVFDPSTLTTCWLKTATVKGPANSNRQCMNAALSSQPPPPPALPPPTAVEAKYTKITTNQDCFGNDLADVYADSAQSCALNCDGYSGCLGFGYYIGTDPALSNVYSHCFLKSAVVPSAELAGISCYALTLPPPPSPPLPPPPSPPSPPPPQPPGAWSTCERLFNRAGAVACYDASQYVNTSGVLVDQTGRGNSLRIVGNTSNPYTSDWDGGYISFSGAMYAAGTLNTSQLSGDLTIHAWISIGASSYSNFYLMGLNRWSTFYNATNVSPSSNTNNSLAWQPAVNFFDTNSGGTPNLQQSVGGVGNTGGWCPARNCFLKNTWIMLSVVRTSTMVQFYVNGTYVANSTAGAVIPYGGQAFVLGTDANQIGASGPEITSFIGQFRALALLPVAHSASDISSIYSQTLAKTMTSPPSPPPPPPSPSPPPSYPDISSLGLSSTKYSIGSYAYCNTYLSSAPSGLTVGQCAYYCLVNVSGFGPGFNYGFFAGNPSNVYCSCVSQGVYFSSGCCSAVGTCNSAVYNAAYSGTSGIYFTVDTRPSPPPKPPSPPLPPSPPPNPLPPSPRPPSPPPSPPPLSTVLGTSCLNILSQYPTLGNGNYNISANGTTVVVYCDMASGGFTYAACTGCTSVNMVTQTNGCASKGLQMVIPRSNAHWRSMINYVTNVLGGSLATYFQIVPGIYKGTSGLSDCAGGRGNLNSVSCNGSGWQAADGGTWWVRNTTFVEPNGDYQANCYLALYATGYSIDTPNAVNIQINDGACAYSTGTSYLCSTNDYNSGLSPSSPPPLPPPTPLPPSPPPPSPPPLSCPAGSFLNLTINACAVCPLGYFTSTSNSSTSCLAAPAGSFVNTTNATAARPCSPGTYQNQTGQALCLPCAVNTFAATFGSIACVPCPPGLYTAGLIGSLACMTPPSPPSPPPPSPPPPLPPSPPAPPSPPMPPSPPAAVDARFQFLSSDTDSRGFDIGSSFYVPNAATCADVCLVTPNCVGFGYYVGTLHPNVYSNCYLKSLIQRNYPLDGFYLYVLLPSPPSPPFIAGNFFQVTFNQTCVGYDILETVICDFASCARRCTATPGCVGFEYDSTIPEQCAVKSAIVPSAAKASANCYQLASSPPPPSPPPPSVPPAPPVPPPSPPPALPFSTLLKVPSVPVNANINDTIAAVVSTLFSNLTSLQAPPTTTVSYDAYFYLYVRGLQAAQLNGVLDTITQGLLATANSSVTSTLVTSKPATRRRSLLQQPTGSTEGSFSFGSAQEANNSVALFTNSTFLSIFNTSGFNLTGAFFVWNQTGVSFKFTYVVPSTVGSDVATITQTPTFQNNFTQFFIQNLNTNVTRVVVVSATPPASPPTSTSAPSPTSTPFVKSTTFYALVALAAFTALSAAVAGLAAWAVRDAKVQKRRRH